MTLLLFPPLLSLKLQFNRLHSLTWILSIKMLTFGACGGVRTHPVHPPLLWACNWAQNGISQKTREIGSLLLRPSEKFKKSETHGRILRVGRSGYCHANYCFVRQRGRDILSRGRKPAVSRTLRIFLKVISPVICPEDH